MTAALAVLPAVLAAGAAAGDVASRWEPLDGYIRREMAAWQLPGLAVAVIADGDVAFSRAYGVRQQGRAEPFERETVIPVGSTTKSMTAALAGMLVDEGKLAWDDPVVKHLPWFQLHDPWVTRQVTVRDLLAHRVGVGGALLPAVTTFDRDEVLRRFRYIEPYAPFRARYDYSNVMYTAAGQVVAAVEGKSWEQVLTERLLRPLGMDSARPSVDQVFDPARVAPCFCCDLPGAAPSLLDVRAGLNVAMPHLAVGDRMEVIPWRRYLNIGPAGGELAASLLDMTRWALFQLGQGQIGRRRLLSEAAFREMHSPQTPIPREARPTYLREAPEVNFMAYGLGWRLNDYRGHLVSVHTGNVYGFMATVGVLHDRNLAVVALANADRAGLAPALVMRVFDMALGPPERDWSAEVRARYEAEAEEERARERELEATRVPGTRPALPLGRYAGTFEDAAYGRVTIAEEDGRLVLRFPGAQTADLEHWHHDLFRMRLRGPMAYPRFARFEIDARGEPTRLRAEGIGTFVRTDEP